MPTLEASLSHRVHPLVGTIQTRWIYAASACVPMGLVALSPDTVPGMEWGGGYRYDKPFVHGFSHLHCWELGGLSLLPTGADVNPWMGSAVYGSAFSHEQEMARAGYHRLHLQKYDITAELTAASHTGVHRYQFPQKLIPQVVVDLAEQLGNTRMGHALIHKVDPQTWEGHVRLMPTLRRPRPVTLYFVLSFSRPVTQAQLWSREKPAREGQEFEQLRAALQFAPSEQPLVIKAALSFVDLAGARAHLSQVPGFDFDAALQNNRKAWDSMLATIQIEGGSDVQVDRFYTDLFRFLVGRHQWSDADGRYTDNTGQTPRIFQAQGYRHFNSDSFWGAQWSITPLWCLAFPGVIQEFAACFMDYYHHGGLIPRGPSGGNYTFVMHGAQTTPAYAAVFHHGLGDSLDADQVLTGLVKNHGPGGLMAKAGYEHETAMGGGVEIYQDRGYIPEGYMNGPWLMDGRPFHTNGAAQTLEHAYADWCLAELAHTLGKPEIEQRFRARSGNWIHLFDADHGLMRARALDGNWLGGPDGYSPLGFTEGNSYHYTFHVPHDIPGLIRAFGSPEKFVERLHGMFETARLKKFITPHGEHDRSTVEFGNEPCLALAHLFLYAGRGDLTDQWLDEVVQAAKAGLRPEDGYGGDEDQGMMAAWNVLVALGLFTVSGGAGRDPIYLITAPRFEEARFANLRITRSKPAGRYVVGIQFNDQTLNRRWLRWSELSQHGKATGHLHVDVADRPVQRTWQLPPAG